jgi:hypothetical protein
MARPMPLVDPVINAAFPASMPAAMVAWCDEFTQALFVNLRDTNGAGNKDQGSKQNLHKSGRLAAKPFLRLL